MFGHRILSLMILSFTACASPFPPSADDKQDLAITSHAFEYDHHTGLAVYTGNVHAKQGTRELWGDVLKIHSGQNGDIDKIVVLGQPAQHASQSNPKKPPVHAKANEIIYYVTQEQLTLKDNAYVEQGGDVYEAPYIEYSVTHETVRSPQNENGQTTITLQPRAKS